MRTVLKAHQVNAIVAAFVEEQRGDFNFSMLTDTDEGDIVLIVDHGKTVDWPSEDE